MKSDASDSETHTHTPPPPAHRRRPRPRCLGGCAALLLLLVPVFRDHGHEREQAHDDADGKDDAEVLAK